MSPNRYLSKDNAALWPRGELAKPERCRRGRRFLALAVFAMAAVLASCKHSGSTSVVASAEPTGTAAFSRFGKFVNARISPKGTYLAVVVSDGGKNSLGFINLTTRQFSSGLTPDLGAMVGNFYWANDQRAVVEVVESDPMYAAPISYGELYGANANGRGHEVIFGRSTMNSEWARMIGRIRNDDRSILIETRPWQGVGDRLTYAYQLDVYGAGIKRQVAVSPILEAEFIADENGEVRIALGEDEQIQEKLFYRDPGGAWRELADLKGLAGGGQAIAFSARDRELYISEALGSGFGLYAFNIDSAKRRLLSKNDIVPPRALLRDQQTGQVIAVEYEPDLPIYDFLVPEHPICRVLSGLLATYPDQHVRLVNRTDDDKKAVVRVYSDRDPGQFLLVDVATMSAEPIVSARPWIRPDQMAAMSALHLNASDGLRIHAYLTLPKADSSAKAPPLVVLPHGGPHGIRDHWGFDPEVQLLASHGFAVLQVNYRGSGGYGRAYEQAGYGKWGDRVIDDILDATRSVVGKGLVDATRVCTYGASFGGYAALQTVIRAPELFRCAAGYAGVYDLSLMDNTGDIHLSRLGRGYVHKAVGDDTRTLRSQSPVYNAEKIQAHVFLIHGRKDERAPFEHAELLKESLTKAGKPPQWLVEPKEGHGFYDEGARERMYGRLLNFLKENTKATETVAAGSASKPN